MARYKQLVFRFLFALGMVALASLLRIWPLHALESRLAWLTFYPAVMISAVYGGLYAGMLAMGLACLTVLSLWPLLVSAPFIVHSADWLGLSVFVMTGTMMSGVAEAMSRAKKKAEMTAASLQNSEARLRALFNTSAIGIVVIDEEGRIEEFNPSCEAIFGYLREEVIGQNVDRLMPDPFRSEHDRYLKNYKASGRSKVKCIERELTGQRKGGGTFPMELNVGEASLGSNRVFVGFIKDISERKQMENSRRHFEAIVQSSTDAIMSKDLEGIVTSWNAGAEAMLGYTAQEMIGQPMLRLFPPDRIDEEKTILRQISNGKRVDHFETMRLRKNGSSVDVSVTLSPIFDEAGRIIGASKIVRDITRSKQMERELQAAKLAAEEASQSKGEFLSNMSHEIRTPMNAVIGLTRLALETELTPKQQGYLYKIQTSSQALLGILNDILDLSKIESGRIEMECIEFDPTLMLQSVSDLFMPKAEEKGLEIFLDVQPEIPLTVMGDPLRIQQVLTNLVSNAIKFTPKGEVHIRMELLDSSGDDLSLRLSVRDTGIGISETAIRNLFQPFSQADASTTRKFGGTGLGLVISKRLVELLGGSIEVTSQPEQGSCFSFTLRCGKGRSYNWMQDSHHIRGTRTLVVDDHETSCQILKGILESWQFEVKTALTAREGLDLIRQAKEAGQAFDLLLLDWQMEGMSGLDLAHELGQESIKDHQHPTIIMVTAYSKEQLLKEAADTLARLDAILIKPIVPSSLLNTILHVYHHNGKEYGITEQHADPYEAARPLRNARILLVEDNELNQQVAGEFLEKAGFRVSIAHHGGEAVRWLEKAEFDAVLMDLQMPEMDGYEATRRIRQLQGCAELPIIAMTAAVMRHDRETCMAVGMNDHVAKPINPGALIDTLLRWVKPKEPLPLLTSPTLKPDAWSDLSDRLQGFELTDIMTMLSGNREKLLHMLAAFRDKLKEEVPVVAAQIDVGDLASAQKRLHTLKGASGNLGARELHRASVALDAELVNGVYEAETLSHWRAIADRTVAILAEISIKPSLTPSGLTLQQALAELDGLLASDSFIDDVRLLGFKTLLPDDKQADYDILARHILDTDYVQARLFLKTNMGFQGEQA